ncbi:MAG: hypothetical protein IIB56_01240 [Planctomycetes bacterium]|nr:hypothetical protein [Planctomycetota bacterium]
MRSFMMKYGALRFLMVFAVVCLSWAIAAAGTGNEGSEEKTGLTDLEQRMQRRIFIDVNDVPLDTVIRQLVEQADLNYIKSPKVIGNVSVTFKDVPLEEALRTILEVYDCFYMLTDNVIIIKTFAEMVEKVEPILTETFEIVYADAEKVAEALDKSKSPQGSVSFIKGTSYIMVTDTESRIRKIKELLEKIDRITPQILVEARIYDITSRDKLDLGVEWQAGRDTAYTALGTETYGTSRITSIGGNPFRDRDPFITGLFKGATSKTSGTSGALRFGWLNSGIDIDAVIKAQQEITEAKLLANPRILVLDNEQATFDIITEHPYVERTISGSQITETVRFKEVGIKLVVTPHVTRDGMIRLKIQPEFGIKVGQVLIESNNVPIVDTRKVNTIALVRDGQTVVLGGMRKKDTTKQINKIPLLGDIPLLGALFRFEGEDTAVTELIVFITPRIITQPVLSLDEQLAFEETKFSRPEPSSTRAEKKIAEK